MSRARKILIGLAAVFGVLVLAVVLAGVIASEPRPTGEPGPAADALAREIQASVALDAWEKTGAVQWGFGGRQQHLWDKQRMLARVSWGEHRVWLDLGTREGVAQTAGERVEGEVARALLDQAYAHWANDSFWLNPFGKLFDDGTTRAIVKTDDGEGLLISYGSGGVTPGDAYLWIRGDDGKPKAWKMWVSIIPIGGLLATWENWITTESGAAISTRHSIGGFLPLELTDVKTAASAAALAGGEDPFAVLGR